MCLVLDDNWEEETNKLRSKDSDIKAWKVLCKDGNSLSSPYRDFLQERI